MFDQQLRPNSLLKISADEKLLAELNKTHFYLKLSTIPNHYISFKIALF